MNLQKFKLKFKQFFLTLKMKIWYVFCALFFANCIVSLIKDIFNVTYVSNAKNETKFFIESSTQYLISLPIKSLVKENVTFMDLIDLRNHFKIFLINHLKNKYEEIDQTWLRQQKIKKIFPFIENGSYLMFKNQVCLKIFDKKSIEILYEIFQNQISFYVFNNITYNHLKFKGIKKFFQLIVSREEYPYSNCLKNYQKFSCLNECFVKKNRLSKYYYTENETGLIYFKPVKSSLSIQKDETDCFSSCEADNCIFVHFFMHEHDLNHKAFKAIILLPTFDFWFQLIGLYCLFNKISLYQIFKKFIIKINFKLKNFKKYISLFVFYMLISIGILLSFYLFYRCIIDYLDKDIIKKEIESYLFVLEPFDLCLCVPIYLADKKLALDSNYENIFHANKSLSELEMISNKLFEESLDEIYLAFQNKIQPVKWDLVPKVYFKNNRNLLSRCFIMTITFEKIFKYQTLFLNSKLIVKRKLFHDLYLLPKGQPFTENSFNFTIYSFLKHVIKRSNGNRNAKCIDYRKKYSYCSSKSECISHCIQTRFYNEYKNLSFGSLVDKDHFDKKQWANLYLIDNSEIHEEVKNKCLADFKIRDCEKVKFKESTLNSYYQVKEKQLDLNYETRWQIEENLSLYQFLLDLLNIQSILFGLNIWNVLLLILNALKAKIKFKIFSAFLFAIYLFCGLGFVFHSYFIIEEIVKKELVFIQLYEYSESFKVPDYVFCLVIDEALIDENHLLTGSYLNKITENLAANRMFERIEYLNEQNKWIKLNRTSEFNNKQFKIDTFYFLNNKCFKIQLDMIYLEKSFYFEDDNLILKINLNRTIFYELKQAYFYSIIKDTMQFSKTNILKFNKNTKMQKIKVTYLILQELYEIIYYDRFYLILNPFSLFNNENNFNDVDNYIKNMLVNYKKLFNFNTLSLPLQSIYFHEIIDDQLFEQFYYQIQNVTDYNSQPNLNYKRSSVMNYYSRNYRSIDDMCLGFSLSFFKRTLYQTNSESYFKLVINLLNTLSLWLNYSPLDLYVYFYLLVNLLGNPYVINSKIKHVLLILERDLNSMT